MRNIELQDDIAAKLAALAMQNNESLQAAVNHALRDYFFWREEDAKRWEETLSADAAIDNGEGIPGEKIVAWLKSWGSDSELPPP